MKICLLVFCLVTSTWVNNVNAQVAATYQSDLQHLLTIFKKLPSYKAQIKGAKLQTFNARYTTLYNDTAQLVTDNDAFQKLSQLFFLLKDNHLAFYQLPATVLTTAQLTDTNVIRRYRESPIYTNFPRLSIDIDSLENVLANARVDTIEGIYRYDRYLRVALYKSAPGVYTGIVLSTTLPNWDPGQIAIRLYEKESGGYHAIYAHPLHKYHILYNNEKFRNQSLVNSYFYASLSDAVYRKEAGETDFVNLPRTTPPFIMSLLAPDIQYIRLGNFSNNSRDRQVSTPFLERIKDSLTTANLVVDLRNNTGGASAVSKKFIKVIKSFSRRGRVYILQNNGTMSQGEIFLLQLKGKKGVLTLGQTTNGTLAYGSNWGKTQRLPSGKQLVYITDMKSPAKLLQYENSGVEPEVWFENDGDWIEKLLNLIKNDPDRKG